MINWEEKMNNNFYEIPSDWYGEFGNNYMDMYNMPEMFNMGPGTNIGSNLAEPKVALDRGNLFNNLYEPYRNYKYRILKASNSKEELLLNIMMHIFALTELDLYLDLNPNDVNMIGLYNKYLANKKQLVNDYEKKFGPLTLEGVNMGTNNWNWKNMPWPWEGTK